MAAIRYFTPPDAAALLLSVTLRYTPLPRHAERRAATVSLLVIDAAAIAERHYALRLLLMIRRPLSLAADDATFTIYACHIVNITRPPMPLLGRLMPLTHADSRIHAAPIITILRRRCAAPNMLRWITPLRQSLIDYAGAAST